MKMGRGSVYRRGDSPCWWLSYTDLNGKRVRESANTSKKGEAQTLLAKRMGGIARGEAVSPAFERYTFAEAADDLKNEYQANGRKSADELERRIRLHLEPFFGRVRRLVTITTSDVWAFIARRQSDQITIRKARREWSNDERAWIDIPAQTRAVSNGEINRELATLKRMFSFAVQSGRLAPGQRPYIPMLAEPKARAGFFEREQFDAVLHHLPADVRPVVEFAYITGWRVDSEVLPLEWRQVDLQAREVRLDPGSTKNGEGRVFRMPGALVRLLQARAAERDAAKKAGHVVPWVFFRMVAEERGGEKKPQSIKSFRKAFQVACRKAGCPGRIVHDFRRTAVRNLVRAGVPERVAMAMTGHRTRSVFERYNIVSEGDLALAAERLDVLLGGALEATRHESVTIEAGAVRRA